MTLSISLALSLSLSLSLSLAHSVYLNLFPKAVKSSSPAEARAGWRGYVIFSILKQNFNFLSLSLSHLYVYRSGVNLTKMATIKLASSGNWAEQSDGSSIDDSEDTSEDWGEGEETSLMTESSEQGSDTEDQDAADHVFESDADRYLSFPLLLHQLPSLNIFFYVFLEGMTITFSSKWLLWMCADPIFHQGNPVRKRVLPSRLSQPPSCPISSMGPKVEPPLLFMNSS